MWRPGYQKDAYERSIREGKSAMVSNFFHCITVIVSETPSVDLYKAPKSKNTSVTRSSRLTEIHACHLGPFYLKSLKQLAQFCLEMKDAPAHCSAQQ